MELSVNPVNLVLYDANNQKVWQSINFPSDTLTASQYFQPGMKLTSWVSSTSPMNGNYTLIMEPGGLALYDNSFPEPLPYWIWGFFGSNDSVSVKHTCLSNIQAQLTSYNSLVLSNLQNLNDSGSAYWPQFCSLQSQMGTSRVLPFPGYGLSDTSSVADTTFMRLEPDGNLRVYQLSGSTWTKVFDLFGANQCLLPRLCGSYGICSLNSQCNCLNNTIFVPTNSSDYHQGCPPLDSSFTCSVNASTSATEMMQFTNVDYFATKYSLPSNISTEESCQDKCKQNCSCIAAFWHMSDNKCFHVANQIGSLQKVDQSDYVAYFKVHNPKMNVASKTPRHIILIATTSAISALLVLVCCLVSLLFLWRKAISSINKEEDAFLDAIPGLPTRFSYKELQAITNGFGKMVGKGGFGAVYEGLLGDGNKVAVKQLEGLQQGDKEFRSEVAIMGAIHHFNILRLLGFCAQGKHRLLVYEYMENGSLDHWLFKNPKRQSILSWSVRWKIALGTARGLAYLHDECRERIIHLDVKPQNILLDEDFIPKVADMGLSRLLGRADSEVVTTMRGTPGYLAPEWLKGGAIDAKCDVFSFGMLVMEIISGRKNLDHNIEENDNLYYPQWAYKKALEGSIEELTDAKLETETEVQQVRQMISIAFLCVLENPTGRPTMSEVVQMLEGRWPAEEMDLAKLNKDLVFLLRKDSMHESSSSSTTTISSTRRTTTTSSTSVTASSNIRSLPSSNSMISLTALPASQ